MEVLAVIPARGGSKGIIQKNIKLLGGKPLLLYTAESALESKLLSKVIISTDSEEISAIGMQVGIEVPFLRPHVLALDTTPTIDVLKHAIVFYEQLGMFFDAICILQPTTPFREKGFIDQAVQKFISSQADTLISVLPLPHQFNPHWVFEEKEDSLLKIATGENVIIPRRQELPKCYYRDGAIYLVKTEVIMKTNSLFGNSVSYIVSNSDFFVNIDTFEDWQKAEAIIFKRDSRNE